ncbi:MAG: PQQ-like beta-propeller repeat protein [Anaerolineales bacterium]|nr:PQQ-like beta-propeller repeat protein [Anaerolineales bacterium]
MYALNPDGSLKWRYETSDAVYASPALGLDGTIYFGSADDYLYALDSGGALKWRFQLGGDAHSPAVDSNSRIYVSANDGKLYILNPDGSSYKVKEVSPSAWLHHGPVIASNEIVYVADSWGSLYAIGDLQESFVFLPLVTR